MDALRGLADLPGWLLAASVPDVLRAALARAVPEIAAGDVVLHACDPRHFRLAAAGWTFQCRVEAGRVGEEPRVLELEGVLDGSCGEEVGRRPVQAFGSGGWSCRLSELGVELHTARATGSLPLLTDLLDPERARSLLERALVSAPQGRQGPRIAAARPRVMRHDPGLRCTVLYELDYAAGTAPTGVVVAKTYADDRGRTAFDGMRALWSSGLARSGTVALAEPLAYVPELRLLVQGPVPEERSLDGLLRSTLRDPEPAAVAEVSRFLAGTAAALAAIHDCGAIAGEPWTLERELESVCALVERLARHVPALPAAVMPLLTRVAEIAVRHPAGSPRPSHGTFRPDQVLLHGDAVGVVDFDGFCQAEPAFDVARFRSGIRDCGMRDMPRRVGPSTVDVEALCDDFLRAYASAAPVSPERVMLWETLDLVTHVLHAWSRVKPARLLVRVLLLEDHALRAGLIVPTPTAEPDVTPRVDAA